MIEVFADVWCPFAHVGIAAAVAARDTAGRRDLAVHVRAWPLELVNEGPLEVSTTAAHVAALRDQVAPGLFVGFDPASFPATSMPALALEAAAHAHDAATGLAVSLALRNALFERGEDIADAGVLGAIASLFGLGDVDLTVHTSVLADYEEGQRRGVKGSPHFFSEDAESFCPTLDITRDPDGHLLLERNARRLDAFLADWLAR